VLGIGFHYSLWGECFVMRELEATNEVELLIPALPQGDPSKPYFSFDFDGVICNPPFGQNRLLSRKLYDDELPEVIRRVDARPTSFRGKGYRNLRNVVESLKYYGRIPLPHAKEGVAAVAEHRNLVIITGRSFLAKRIVEVWLKRYEMDKYFLGIYANFTDLRTRKYKLHMLRGWNITEHAEDDGGITCYLANRGIGQLYLRDWNTNAGMPYPDNVFHFTNIVDIARHIEQKQVK
jgi:hypothetical protein